MPAKVESVVAPAIPSAEEFFIELGGVRVRYLRAGSGPPLLLIHGLLGYSFCWRCNFAELGRHFDVIAPDLPGIGFSQRVMGIDCSVGAAARRMLRLLDALGIGQAHVLGNSHGGAIATAMAAMHPERVRKLVLVAPVNPWSKQRQWLISLVASRAGGVLFPAVWMVLKRVHRYALERMYGDVRRIAPGTLEGYDAGAAQPGTREHLLGILRCWNSDQRELEHWYRSNRVPALLLWGDRDRAVLPSSAHRVQQALPNAELVTLPGVGHLPQEEAPDEFHRIVLEFLSRK